jgi:hypothetical protein
MSVMAVGPALDIDGPLPQAPLYSLLSVPGVLAEDGEGRWMNGVNVDGYPEGTPESWEPCSSGTFRTKVEESTMSRPRFDAFGLYIPIQCSSLSVGPNWEEFAARAEAVLEATESWGVERALAAGVVTSGNPFLGDSNVVVLGGGAVAPQVGLSYLEQAIGETGRQGLIHAPPEVVAAWGFDKIETGLSLRTVNGTPVAKGGGYSGVDANGSSPAVGQSYAFATGPVKVYLSEMSLVSDTLRESLDRSNNDVVFRAERYAIAAWDTALQVAVLIDWSP